MVLCEDWLCVSPVTKATKGNIRAALCNVFIKERYFSFDKFKKKLFKFVKIGFRGRIGRQRELSITIYLKANAMLAPKAV